MTVEEFKEQMLYVLNREEAVDLDTNLADIEEWDSVAYVAYLSMTAEYTDRIIRAAEIRSAKTMRDLYNLIVND